VFETSVKKSTKTAFEEQEPEELEEAIFANI